MDLSKLSPHYRLGRPKGKRDRHIKSSRVHFLLRHLNLARSQPLDGDDHQHRLLARRRLESPRHPLHLRCQRLQLRRALVRALETLPLATRLLSVP
jgi:hypothetical protein